MLIIFGGLPGSGKSTLSLRLAEKLSAVYVRVDSIETAISESSLNIKQANESGYLAGYSIAKDNLRIGHTVIADSVNPIHISREGWRNVAIRENYPYLEIEIICSDKKEHQHRIESRNADLHNTMPIITWEEVKNREYDVWDTADLKLDTFKMNIETCIENIIKHIKT